MTTNTHHAAIYAEAQEAAVKAAAAELAPYGGQEPATHLECGFAWVVIRPGTSPFARWMRAKGLADKHWAGGLNVWNPAGTHVQWMVPKLAGARAFAAVLRKHGIAASADSRLD